MTDKIKFNAASRSALRKAITKHDDWPLHRVQHGLKDASQLTVTLLKTIGADMGLDVQSYDAALPQWADGYDQEQHETAKHDSAKHDSAKQDSARSDFAGADSEQDSTKQDSAKQDNDDDNDAAEIAAVIATALGKRKGAAVDMDQVKVMVDAAVKQAMTDVQLVTVKLERSNGTSWAGGTGTDEHIHPMFLTLLQAAGCRDVTGNHINVWIAGPAGSGKTHAAKQLANAMSCDFGFHGAAAMAHELTGFVDAGGTYHETVFVRLFQAGGVCLLDELDGWDNAALLALNAGLANGQLSLPNGQIVQRHPDFICLGAANTFGQGATASYVGRAKLDAAFLSRFPVKLSWGYDEKLERAICGDAQWANVVQSARKAADAAGLQVIIDPRHSIAGAALLASGMGVEEVKRITFLSGLSDDQAAVIKPALATY